MTCSLVPPFVIVHAMNIFLKFQKITYLQNIRQTQAETPIDPYEVITGDRLNSFTDIDWKAIIAKKYVVFARTTPEHKLFIVENCRQRGRIRAPV